MKRISARLTAVVFDEKKIKEKWNQEKMKEICRELGILWFTIDKVVIETDIHIIVNKMG